MQLSLVLTQRGVPRQDVVSVGQVKDWGATEERGEGGEGKDCAAGWNFSPGRVSPNPNLTPLQTDSSQCSSLGRRQEVSKHFFPPGYEENNKEEPDQRPPPPPPSTHTHML